MGITKIHILNHSRRLPFSHRSQNIVIGDLIDGNGCFPLVEKSGELMMVSTSV